VTKFAANNVSVAMSGTIEEERSRFLIKLAPKLGRNGLGNRVEGGLPDLWAESHFAVFAKQPFYRNFP
jgi:hypothetical protein